MVEGRLRKYYEEVVLLEQPFVMDNKVKVGDLIKDAAKSIKADINIKGFARLALGDGADKKEE